jgi:hypothetical protein
LLLLVSIAGNAILENQLYEHSKVTVSDYLVFQGFQNLLNRCVQLVDETSLESGDKQIQTIQDFNKTKRQALGIIQGLSPEARKRGMNMENLMVDLFPELGNPNDPSFSTMLTNMRQNLHFIESKLKGKTYQQGSDFEKLKEAINSIPKQ